MVLKEKKDLYLYTLLLWLGAVAVDMEDVWRVGQLEHLKGKDQARRVDDHAGPDLVRFHGLRESLMRN